MNKNTLLIVGGALIIFVIGVVQLFSPRSAVSPSLPVATSTTEQNVSTTTSTAVPALDVKGVTVSSPARAVSKAPSIVKGDSIASWTFRGAYADNTELITKAIAEIVRLSGLVGKGDYPDVSLYVGIANQYELLGDGSLEYDYLGRAIMADIKVTSGLPWHNLGVLMERLGALETARVAYEESTIVQPELKQWHYAYLEFLTTRMRDNIAVIEKAFATAQKYVPNDTDILQLRSEWQKS